MNANEDLSIGNADISSFIVNNVGREVIKLCPNGDIFVHGKLICNDVEGVILIKKALSGNYISDHIPEVGKTITAEEILNKYDVDFFHELDREYYTDEILKAMQEFAESYHAAKVAAVTDEMIEQYAFDKYHEVQRAEWFNPLQIGAKWFKSQLK